MKINKFNTSKNVFIVAEIGNNHEGSIIAAKNMISAAADAGVNAVKFQTIVPELFVSKNNFERFKKLKSFQLKYSQFETLANFSEKKGVLFCSTPFDLETAKFLNNIQTFFKISSGDNEFYPLIDQICKFKKPIILSTGLVDIKQIKKIVKFISNYNFYKKNNLGLLHCVSSYPTDLFEINLKSIKFLKNFFSDLTIGFSDHTLGIEASLFSVACGAEIVEKHFTLNKNYSNFRDHQLSADPKEMKSLVNKIRSLEKILGTEQKKINISEKKSVIEYKRSIAANKNLSKGSKIKKNDIMWIRPGQGFQPGQEKKILNKKLTKDIKQGEIFNRNYFQK